MHANEVRDWVQKTADCFPQVGRLFEKSSDKQGLADSWSLALVSVPKESAFGCIQAMVNGDIATPAFADDWAKLPAIVRQWSRDNKALPAALNANKWAENPSYRCLSCLDRGMGVEVFNPLWVRRHDLDIEQGSLSEDWMSEARRECRTEGWGSFTYACDCSCETGRAISERRRDRRQVYFPAIHCLVPPGGSRGYLDALKAFVATNPFARFNEWSYAGTATT